MKRKEFILQAEGVNKTFDGFKAISDLNFYMDEGELRTVIGPNGAGKTTFMDLITGRTKPDTGHIKFGPEAVELTKKSEYEIYRLGVGRKFQTPTVYGDHTVFENILLSLEGSRGVFASSVLASHAGAAGSHPRGAEDGGARRARKRQRPARWRTGRSNGWRSACCWRRTPSCCWWTNRPRA